MLALYRALAIHEDSAAILMVEKALELESLIADFVLRHPA